MINQTRSMLKNRWSWMQLKKVNLYLLEVDFPYRSNCLQCVPLIKLNWCFSLILSTLRIRNSNQIMYFERIIKSWVKLSKGTINMWNKRKNKWPSSHIPCSNITWQCCTYQNANYSWNTLYQLHVRFIHVNSTSSPNSL